VELFDRTSPELSITEVAEALDAHKGKMAGLVYTQEENKLVRAATTCQYHLGLRLAEQAATLLEPIDVAERGPSLSQGIGRSPA